ncbi:uncharacterized protein A4U43_C03F19310 [Asparagus officinalis]|uniref:Uncharacterized protein n=1 Tax=Asparagus officinalis TaxID=4686 RepID=A0A5P1FGH4_ASPOF|nr:uncharacterized protein A4U43_C03F19310 [Asparagus officinalis]
MAEDDLQTPFTDVGETDLQTIPMHSIPSGHSTVGGDASASTSIARPLHLRNYHPNRAARRAEKRVEKAGGLPRTSQKVRSTNKADRLMPDPEKNEPTFLFHFDEYLRVTGPNAERFGQYVGQKSRQYMDFPLYTNWGPDHERSFDKFFLQAQKDYEFLPVDPYCPLNLPAVHRGVKIKMQERVRGNRNQVKRSVMNCGWRLPKRKEMIFSRQRCSKGSIKNGGGKKK